MSNAALATRQNGSGTNLAQRLAPDGWTREYVDFLKEKYGRGCTDIEFAHAVQVSKVTKLRIDTGELWVYKRNANEPVTITISVTGLRAIAHESGEFDGEEGPLWCGKDGVWKEVWLDDEPPVAAKFSVWRRGIARAFTSVILLKEFRNNSPFWRDRPVYQSGVRVATHSFRHAFRQEIADRQASADAEGLHLAVDPESALPPGEEYAEFGAASLPTPAPGTDPEYARLVRAWNQRAAEADQLGVDYDDIRPPDLSKATNAEIVAAGKQLRERIDAARAKTAPAAPEPVEEAPTTQREFGAALAAGEIAEGEVVEEGEFVPDEGEAPAAPPADDWRVQLSPTMQGVWAEWDAVAARADLRGLTYEVPKRDAKSAAVLDAITALEKRLAEEEQPAAKAKRK